MSNRSISSKYKNVKSVHASKEGGGGQGRWSNHCPPQKKITERTSHILRDVPLKAMSIRTFQSRRKPSKSTPYHILPTDIAAEIALSHS